MKRCVSRVVGATDTSLSILFTGDSMELYDLDERRNVFVSISKHEVVLWKILMQRVWNIQISMERRMCVIKCVEGNTYTRKVCFIFYFFF